MHVCLSCLENAFMESRKLLAVMYIWHLCTVAMWFLTSTMSGQYDHSYLNGAWTKSSNVGFWLFDFSSRKLICVHLQWQQMYSYGSFNIQAGSIWVGMSIYALLLFNLVAHTIHVWSSMVHTTNASYITSLMTNPCL